MKIPEKPMDAVFKVYAHNRTEEMGRVKASSDKKIPEKDQLVLSEFAQVMHVARQALQKVPEIRMDKVLAAQEAIKNGTYKVTGTDIAEAMLQETQQKLEKE